MKKQIITTIGIGLLGLISPKIDGIEITPGYVGYDQSLISNDKKRSRFISNHKIDFNGFELNHHGYNEFFDFKESSYFGRHRFHTPLLKIKDNKIFWDIKLHAEADLYFDEHGIFDERYGLRVYGPASQLGNLFNGGYGYSEITGNSDIIRFTNYSGIKIDDKFGLEFFNAIDYKKNGSVGEYYDVLLSNNVGNNTDVFINGIRNSKNKTIFGGFRINF